MIIELTEQQRLRCLWHFLLKASAASLPLDYSAVVEVFGNIDDELSSIEKVYVDNQLPNLRGVLSDQKNIPFVTVSGDILQRFKHGVSEFPVISTDESLTFNILCAHYCFLNYVDDSEMPSCLSALEFWVALEWSKIASSILSNLNGLIFDIVERSFVTNDARHKGNVKNSSTQFVNYSSKHAFLIVYQRNFSEKLQGLRELAEYYHDEQTEVETIKGRAGALIENTKEELEKEVKKVVNGAVVEARKLVDEAVGRYPANLLAGYVKQFEKDAAGYGATSQRWLLGLVLSFAITLGTAAYFLGHFQLKLINPVVTFWEEIINYHVFWLLPTIVAVVAIYRISQGKNWLAAFIREDQKGLLGALKTILLIMIFGVPFLALLYLIPHYFQISIDVPAVTASTFLIPQDEKTNWAALLSSATPRIIVLGLASAVTLFCARMYGIQKNLEAINKYRATALASFDVFVTAAGGESDAAIERKDRLFDELASLIYSPIQTGFNRDTNSSSSEFSNFIAAIKKLVK